MAAGSCWLGPSPHRVCTLEIAAHPAQASHSRAKRTATSTYTHAHIGPQLHAVVAARVVRRGRFWHGTLAMGGADEGLSLEGRVRVDWM